jgi:maltose O-acetyltransferase
MFRHLVNFFLLVLPPSRLFGLRRFILRICNVEVGSNVCFCGGGWIYGRGNLSIGDDTWLSPRIIIYTHEAVNIQIGSNCDIGPEVSFVTGSHYIGDKTRRAGTGCAAPIVIGDGCWIGAGSTILGGVTIGSGCIIAAGSVVTKSISDNTLSAGVPAIAKRELI